MATRLAPGKSRINLSSNGIDNLSADDNNGTGYLDDLAKSSGAWLRGDGPDADIVVSSRVRLARNVAGFPFMAKADDDLPAATRGNAPVRRYGHHTAPRFSISEYCTA